MKIVIGEKIRFHIQLNGGKKVEVEGLINGQVERFGRKDIRVHACRVLEDLVISEHKRIK